MTRDEQIEKALRALARHHAEVSSTECVEYNDAIAALAAPSSTVAAPPVVGVAMPPMFSEAWERIYSAIAPPVVEEAAPPVEEGEPMRLGPLIARLAREPEHNAIAALAAPPAQPGATVLHLARVPFFPWCGADQKDQSTTEYREEVTCLACLRAALAARRSKP